MCLFVLGCCVYTDVSELSVQVTIECLLIRLESESFPRKECSSIIHTLTHRETHASKSV